MTLFSRNEVWYSPTSDDYVFHQLIPYLGNKRKLVSLIQRSLRGIPRDRFVDFFSGSGVVSRLAKKLGFSVLSNDWEPYTRCLNLCCITCNAPPPFSNLGGYTSAIQELNQVSRVGWVTRTLCPENDPPGPDDRAFFTRENGTRLDGIRQTIQRWRKRKLIDRMEEACLLAPLLYAASYVSNTSGVFKGFHNGWGGSQGTAQYRILSTLTLEPATFFDNHKNNATRCEDALELSRSLSRARVAYLDPPYNQHPYGSNYHVLNSLALYDKPPAPGRAAIRPDWQRSPYNSTGKAMNELSALIQTIQADHILISYSSDGIIPMEDLVRVLADKGGKLEVHLEPYKRYRVSSTRRSPTRNNIEFILALDLTSRTRTPYRKAMGVIEQALATLRG